MFFVSDAQRPSSCSCLLGKEDFICLLPVISAAKNEPGVQEQVSTFEHSRLPGWDPFVLPPPKPETNTLSIWRTGCQQISHQAVARQRRSCHRLWGTAAHHAAGLGSAPSVAPRVKLQMLLAQSIFQGEEGKSPRVSEQN